MSQQSDNSNEMTGSSNSDEPVFLVIGQLGKPHGVRGEISFRILTDFPERIAPGKVIYIGDEKTPHPILQVRGGGERLILSFDGFFDRDQIALLRNELVFVRSDEIPDLDEGEFYLHDLLGLRVVTDDGRDLGLLEEIIETGANDVFVVISDEGKEFLLPVIDDVVLAIDLEEETILVHIIEGL